ncbi:MFS transporter [Brachybacterium hainanense]|uniref:MFS transporter n=1 Tax=Brachybacterium hainanense TaxID=1541174 RepID=A0ABV6REM7_9MICO
MRLLPPTGSWPRDFRLHFAARLSAGLGSQGTYVATPLVALLTFSPAQAALVTAASYLSTLLVGVPAGLLADHTSRRRVMAGAEAVQLIAMLGLAGCFASASPPLALVCALSFVNGAMFAVFGAASSSAVPDLVDRSELTGALSAMQGRDAVISVIGPVIGAALVAVAPWLPFVVAAATFGTAVLLLAGISQPLHPRPSPDGQDAAPGTGPGSRRGRAVRGFSLILAQPVLRGVVAAQVLLSLVLTGSFFTVIAVLSQRGVVIGSGAVTAAMGAGLLLGSVLAGRVGGRWSVTHAVLVQALVWTGCMGLLALWAPVATWSLLALMVPVLALMWLLVPASRVALELWIADRVAREERGRLQSGRGVLMAVASPLGPTLSGLLLAGPGAPAAFAVLAAASLLAAVLVTLLPRSLGS